MSKNPDGLASFEQMADAALATGTCTPAGRPAFLSWLKRDQKAAMDAVCARVAATRAVTPATPEHAASGASVAAGSAPATAYPSAWSRAVSAAQRITGIRKAQPAKSAWPVVTPSAQVAGTSAPQSNSGFYDKSVKPSGFAAAQQAAREADQQRMAAEQRARGIG